jgi:beta-lactamase class A
MRPLTRVALLATLLPSAVQAQASSLRAALQARMARDSAVTVGFYYQDLAGGGSLAMGADIRMHAASTMKVPVLVQLFRDVDAGRLTLDDSLTVTDTFPSLVDGSPFGLNRADDSDSTLYDRVGRRAAVRELIELMITKSSNLATNLLIARVQAARVQATLHLLGADSVLVRRGVEDGKAYEAGLNNTTTARGLGVLLAAIATGKAASAASCRTMLAILARQHFNDGIPAGLPPGTVVAHKTGWITGIEHDAAIVLPGGLAAPGAGYVLVVLTRGPDDRPAAQHLTADLSRLVWESRR